MALLLKYNFFAASLIKEILQILNFDFQFKLKFLLINRILLNALVINRNNDYCFPTRLVTRAGEHTLYLRRQKWWREHKPVQCGEQEKSVK